MNLIRELRTLMETKTFTYRLTYDGHASLYNHPHDIDDDKLNAGQETFEHDELRTLENRMRENLASPEQPSDGVEVVDFKLERINIDTAQLLHDIDQDADDLAIDDVYDGDDAALKDRWEKAKAKNLAKQKADKPFTWAVEQDRAAACGYRIEAILVTDKPMTDVAAKSFADEMGGTIWGQYWDDGGDATPEYEEIKRPVNDTKPAKKELVDKNAVREAWKKQVLAKYPNAWFQSLGGVVMAYTGKEQMHGTGENLVGSFTRPGKNGSFIL